MHKTVIISGFVGAIVFLVWTFGIKVLFGFNARFDKKNCPTNEKYTLS